MQKEENVRYIETERLILRPLAVEDAADVFEWTSDPIVNKFLRYSLYTNVEDVKKWILSINPSNNEFAVVLKENGKVIGSGGVSFVESKNSYELGYNYNRNYWGHGYATEAAKAMIAWAHNELGAHEFTSAHAIANVASGNVIKKCGFKFSHLGQYSRFDGSETFEVKFYTLHLD